MGDGAVDRTIRVQQSEWESLEAGEVEDGVPLRSSKLWEMQASYYESTSIRAWTDSVVPNFVTSNAVISRAYAQILLAFARDRWLEAERSGVDVISEPPGPVYVLEIGSGHGRLGYNVATEVLRDRGNWPGVVRLARARASGDTGLEGEEGAERVRQLRRCPIVWVATDFCRETCDFLLRHPRLAPLMRLGAMQVGVLDAERIPESLELLPSGVSLGGSFLARERGSLCAVCNYVLDTVRQDSLVAENGVLWRARTHLRTKEGEGHPLDRTLVRWSYVQVPEGEEARTFGGPGAGAVARWYREFSKKVGTEALVSALIPVGGFAMLQGLWRLAGDAPVLLLAGDKAYSAPHELLVPREGVVPLERVSEGRSVDPHMAHHGSFSLMANFHALALWAAGARDGVLPDQDRIQAANVLVTPYGEGFKCLALPLSGRGGTLPRPRDLDLRMTWRTEMGGSMSRTAFADRAWPNLSSPPLPVVRRLPEDATPEYAVRELRSHVAPPGRSAWVVTEEEAVLLRSMAGWGGYSPDAFSVLQRSLREKSAAPPVSLVCALLRLSAWDSDVFFKFRLDLIEKGAYIGPAHAHDLAEDIRRVARRHLPLCSNKDVPFETARVLMGLKRYDEASQMFLDSQRLWGEHHVSWYNLGICHHFAGDFDSARACFNRVLQLRPGYGLAIEWGSKNDHMVRDETAIELGRIQTAWRAGSKDIPRPTEEDPFFVAADYYISNDDDVGTSGRSVSGVIYVHPREHPVEDGWPGVDDKVFALPDSDETMAAVVVMVPSSGIPDIDKPETKTALESAKGIWSNSSVEGLSRVSGRDEHDTVDLHPVVEDSGIEEYKEDTEKPSKENGPTPKPNSFDESDPWQTYMPEDPHRLNWRPCVVRVPISTPIDVVISLVIRIERRRRRRVWRERIRRARVEPADQERNARGEHGDSWEDPSPRPSSPTDQDDPTLESTSIRHILSQAQQDAQALKHLATNSDLYILEPNKWVDPSLSVSQTVQTSLDPSAPLVVAAGPDIARLADIYARQEPPPSIPIAKGIIPEAIAASSEPPSSTSPSSDISELDTFHIAVGGSIRLALVPKIA